MTQPKVLYIAGWGRSGSTVLEQVLGGAEGWFACGELNLAWHDLVCGCGAAVLDCEFWGPVLRETLARHGLDPAGVIALRERVLGPSSATLVAIARERRRRRDAADSRLRRYAGLLTDLYGSIARAAGARVLVDSSKTAPDAYLISMLTDVELYVVHLVRDPRATAFSWSRKKARSYDPLVYFGKLGPARSSINWLRRNAVLDALVRRSQGDRYLRVSYEDLVERPEATARSVCGLVGERDARLPFTGEHRVRLRPNHTVAGNPVRFSRGELEIRPDDEWRTRMGRRPRAVATLAAAPLMPRYGYRLLSGRPR